MALDGVAFIVGAGSGIGLETALTFAERGASAVVFADINLEAAHTAANTGQNVATHSAYRSLTLRVDVTDKASVEAAVKETVDNFKRIDYFVNTAGVLPKQLQPIADVEVNDFNRLHDVNTTGVLFCIQVAAEVMRNQQERFVEGRHGRRSVGRGSITTLVSIAALIGARSIAAYGASKHGALGVIRAAAVELGNHAIRVNAVCPSFVDTPIIDLFIASGPDAWVEQNKLLPYGRLAMPEEIAGLVHFLSGPDSSYISGADVVVDGAIRTRYM